MNQFIKYAMLSLVLMTGSVSFAQTDELSVCERLDRAYSKTLAARQIVSSSNATAAPLDSILQSLRDARIYHHCGASPLASTGVYLTVDAPLLHCSGYAVVNGLVDATIRNLQPILIANDPDAYRNQAYSKAVALSATIRGWTSASSSCR